MSGQGLNIDVSDPRQMMRLMRSSDGIKDLLLKESDAGVSPAHILADIFTILRADTARLGREFGLSIEIEKMSAERAAELLAGCVDGDGVELVQAFNREAERRDLVLRAVLDAEDYDRFIDAKVSNLYTAEPIEHDDEPAEYDDDEDARPEPSSEIHEDGAE